MPQSHYKHRGLLAFTLYLVFVIYGSLVPLEYRAHTLDEALQKFAQIPWLQLSAEARADWVSNLVLYIPLTFLGCVVLAETQRSWLRSLRVLAVLGFCVALAVAVEFTQIFFAPRTVSLNDLVAEILGSLVGITIWWTQRNAILRLWQDFLAGGRRSLVAAIAAVTVAFFGLSLFPFDFVVSTAELSARLASEQVTWLVRIDGNELRTLARLVGEALFIAPLGLLMGLLAGRFSLRGTLLVGIAFGLSVEVIQLFIVSAVSQGLSVFTRGLGLAAGAWLGCRLHHVGLAPLARLTVRWAIPLLLLYLAGLTLVAGWWQAHVSTQQALANLEQVKWLPFWYHYYTSEPVALASLLTNLAIYAPLGGLAWALHTTTPRRRRRGSAQPMLWAVAAAGLVEASKLWLPNNHPDPTNLLIAAVGAAITYAGAQWLTRVSAPGQTPVAATAVATGPEADAAPGKPARARPGLAMLRPPVWAAAISAAIAPLLVIGLLHQPYWAWLCPVLAGAAWLLWRRPWLWPGLLLAALPVLDLAPLSGRQLLDAFDLLVLTAAAVLYWRLAGLRVSDPPGIVPRILYLLLWLSALFALRPAVDPASFSWQLDASHSPMQALWVGKGMVWALTLAPLMLFLPTRQRRQAQQGLIGGLAAGLTLLSLAVLWERQVFVGLDDFSGVYRVTGTFSSMYNGGAYIEAYIAMSFPALLLWTINQRNWAMKAGGLLMAIAASYAMMVTYSRAGFLGLGVSALLALLLLWRTRTSGRTSVWLLPLLLAACAAAVIPVVSGQFAQQRLQQSGTDLQTRLDHWHNALSMVEGAEWWAGKGFGRYPTEYLLHADPDRPPGTYVLIEQDDERFLRLGGGEPYYLDQVIGFDRNRGYQVSAVVRFGEQARELTLYLCEKALLYSFACTRAVLEKPAQLPTGVWHRLDTPLDWNPEGGVAQRQARTIKFSIAGPPQGSIDVDRVELYSPDGRQILRNSDFSQGLSHWMPSIDFDLPWHIHQGQLEVLFAQGMAGVVLMILCWLTAVITVVRQLPDAAPWQLALAAGLSGFVAISLLSSNMDAPRTLFLYYLAAMNAWLPVVLQTKGFEVRKV